MKNILLSAIAVLFLALGLNAQKVHEDDVNMSLGIKNALYVEIEGADRKTTEKVWKDFIKEYGKTKKNKKAKEWYSVDLTIPAIQNAPSDLYLKFEELKGSIRAYLWVDLGTDFLNTIDHPREGEGAEIFLQELHTAVRKAVVKKEVTTQEKLLKNEEKELEKLVKKNSNLHSEIEKFKEKIAKAEAEIEENLVKQEKQKATIEEQKKTVEAVIEKLNTIGRS